MIGSQTGVPNEVVSECMFILTYSTPKAENMTSFSKTTCETMTIFCVSPLHAAASVVSGSIPDSLSTNDFIRLH